jgi:O-antigen/teichoic acid export membrane protein
MAGADDRKLGWEALKGFAGKIIQAILGFAGTIIFARALGPISFGGFYFLLSLVFIVERPIQGFGQAIRKRWSEVDAPKGEFVGSILLINAVFFTVVGLLVVTFADRLRDATNIPEAPLAFMLILVSLGLFSPGQKMLLGEGRVAMQTWTDTLRSVLTFPLQLAFVVAGFGAAGMGYGLALATFATVPVTLYVLEPPVARPTRRALSSLWEFAKYSIPTSFIGKTYERLDTLLLGMLIGTAVVGDYEVAFKLTVPAMFLSSVVISGLLPKISHRVSKGEDVTRDVNNTLGYISIVSVPIFFGALALPETLIVTAYSAKYSGAKLFLVGLAFYQILKSQTGVYVETVGGLDRPELNLKIGAATLALNVVLGVALIFAIGGLGVVVATIVAESFRWLTTYLVARRLLSGIQPIQRPFLVQLAAGAIMYLVVEFATTVVPTRSWLEVGLLVGLGAAVYATVLLTSRLHRETASYILEDAGIY